MQDQLLAYARDLRHALEQRHAAADELARTHLETVAALAAAIDIRDEVTGGHVYRVANYGLALADLLTPDLAADPQLVYGFLLHDIGKLAVPDSVLLKTGPLDEHERALMREHVEHGVRFVERVAFLRPAMHVIATHHERWDGEGYPRGLSGEEIPLVTRLFSVCDAFDAMIHDRPYRRGRPVEWALRELRRGAGSQWDPDVVAGFEEILDRILKIDERPEVPYIRGQAGPRRARELTLSGNLLFDAVEEGLLLVSPDGVVRDANTPFLELFDLARPPVGMTLRELVERVAERFVDHQARRRAAALPDELFAARSRVTLELRAPEPKVVQGTAHTLYDDNGTVAGRLLVFHDVTPEHRRDARHRAQTANLRVSLQDALARLDEVGGRSDPQLAEHLGQVRAHLQQAMDELESRD